MLLVWRNRIVLTSFNRSRHNTSSGVASRYNLSIALNILKQLISGIRVLDIRLVVFKGHLIASHGATAQNANFTSILEDVCAFIQSPAGRSETVVMSIKEEDSIIPSSPSFSRFVQKAIYSQPSRRELWFLENRVPSLGEVRGKIVLFSRFGMSGEGWDGGINIMGIHPPIWPKSRREGFEWTLAKTRVRAQDWYAIPSSLSIPEKFQVAVEMLHPRPALDGKEDLAITFSRLQIFRLRFRVQLHAGLDGQVFSLG